MLPAHHEVSLREVTRDTVRSICDLSVKDGQENLVASNAESIAEAYFHDYAWFRGIYAGDTPVGFVMLADQPDIPEYYLWRFMIDGRYQGAGYGRRGLELLITHVKNRPGATELLLSIVPGAGSPQVFYEKSGFVLTGEHDHGEAMMKLSFEQGN